MSKSIKLFEGVTLTTKTETKQFPDMTVFETLKCSKDQKDDIIRGLLMCGSLDLSYATPDKSKLILALY